MNKHQTAVAAEAFAAGVFAQAGFSVFVQYGANQPGYDLVASDDNSRTMHVSVKGSTTGWFVLAIKDKNETYQGAHDAWVAKNKNFVFCLVQFDKVKPGQMPHMYLATGDEIGRELQTHYFDEVNLALAECWKPTRGKHKGKTAAIPSHWLMTESRIRYVMDELGGGMLPQRETTSAS